MRLGKRLAFAALVTALVLGTLEGALRLTGIERKDELLSPLLFQRFVHLGSLRVTTPEGVRWGDGPVTLAAPAGARLAVLGGSAVQGDKMTLYGRFSNLLERRLAWRLQGAPVEIVNLGRGGLASRHVAEMLDALLDEGGIQLAVIETGNNEFHELRALKAVSPAYGPNLERTRHRLHGLRLYRLLQRLLGRTRVAPFDDLQANPLALHQIGIVMDAADHELAAMLYRENLQHMIDAARAHGVPLLLCTVPDNRLDYVDTIVGGSLSPAGEAALARIETAARRRASAEVRLLVEEHDADLQTELAQFHVGRALLGLGDLEAARRHLDQAELLALRPLRSDRVLRQIVRDLAKAEGLPLCDLASALDADADEGIAGNDLFDDPCHPNTRGHERIALALQTCLEEAALPPFDGRPPVGSVPDPLPHDPFRLDHDARIIVEPIPEPDLAPGTALALTGHVAFAERRLDEALDHYRQAREAGGPPGPLLVSEGLVLLHQGQLTAGRARLEEAATLLPDDPELRRHIAVLTEQGAGSREQGAGGKE